MVAGYVLLSAFVGVVFLCTAIALSVPVWVALVAYPLVSSLTLLLCAVAWNIRSSTQRDQLSREYSHG
jgi:membrane protein implicated in regulation of membrane protease activity